MQKQLDRTGEKKDAERGQTRFKSVEGPGAEANQAAHDLTAILEPDKTSAGVQGVAEPEEYICFCGAPGCGIGPFVRKGGR
jgi:hypothetical protein